MSPKFGVSKNSKKRLLVIVISIFYYSDRKYIKKKGIE